MPDEAGIAALNRALWVCAELLRLSQPPTYEKYDIRWWKTSLGWRRAQLVKWKKASNGRMRPKKVERFRPDLVRRDRGFEVNYDETVQLIESFLKANAALENARSRIRSARRVIEQENRRLRLVAADLEEMMVGIKARIVSNLRERGYPIEPRYLGGLDEVLAGHGQRSEASRPPMIERCKEKGG